MYFKILFIKQIPAKDLSVAITTKFESFDKRMVLNAGDKKIHPDSDFFVYSAVTEVSAEDDARLFIYTEKDEVIGAGDKWISSSIDSLKMLCEMNEYPCVVYESPMEKTAIIAAIRNIYSAFPDEMVAVCDAFGLSDAECKQLEADFSNKIDNPEPASIPQDTEFTINNSVFLDGNEPESYDNQSAIEATEALDDIKVSGLDMDDLANKIAARINNKNILDKSTTNEVREMITTGNILKTQTESIHEWVVRVFLSGANVDDTIRESYDKILNVLDKALTYICKATESTILKSEKAMTDETPKVEKSKEESKPEPDVTEEKEELPKEEKSIYTDNDNTEDEVEDDATESFDESDTIMLQAVNESSNDSEFFNYIKRYKDELSTEALDNIAKYNMYEKLTSVADIENGFTVYNKRRTILGI